jgi:DNA-binding NtrC family response regulator
VKLLRVLQEQCFHRVGGKAVHVDIRVIAATHRDLETMIARGEFREDLYYRLNVIPIVMPPLCERKEDLEPLARHFLDGKASFTAAALAALHRHAWPGNARELQNHMQREFLMCEGPAIVLRPARPETERRQLADRRVNRAAPAGTLNFNAAKQLTVQAFERDHLIRLMRASTGNVSRAARLAGKERRALGKLLKKYCIEPGFFRTPSNA